MVGYDLPPTTISGLGSARTNCHRELSFDMSDSRQWAKPAVGRPLDVKG